MKPNPFCFLLSALCLVTATATAADWPRVTLASPGEVVLAGPVGTALKRGVERLNQPPYTTDWLLADVSFKLNRAFTNYSGDVSGRFLELAALTSLPGRHSPATLQPVLEEITKYQKADGHYGGEMDFSQPMHNGSAPIPMLWGNARLLVGLVAAANECHRPELLASARRLGDFYCATTNVFCSPARRAELYATGNGGDGYTCCYFPAIEGLALLYRATHEGRYLQQAERMAESFKGFDALPINHSHGNLCAWRGMLELYEITGKRAYLDRALAKWETAVRDGFVWSLGGVGECWYVFYHHDEGCSASDWLRFNLQLWRFTGQTRFLDMAERNLLNQYAANQCPNGGYGVREFDGEPTGPIGTCGEVGECNYCCSFHGPLGLHFLKSYLAAGSDLGVFVNFPLDFASTVKSGNRDWRVTVRTQVAETDQRDLDVELVPADGAKSASTTLWVRRPNWATGAKLTDSAGATLPFSEKEGYLRLKRKFKRGERLHIAFQSALRVEKRRFEPASVASGRISRLREVALLDGPNVLYAAPASGTGRLTLLAQVDSTGRLGFWPAPRGGYLSVALPGFDVDLDQITMALASAEPITLRPASELRTGRRMTFIHDLIVVPAKTLGPSAANGLAARAAQAAQALSGPFFGQRLELSPDIWTVANGWQFASNALEITGGDVGLLDGQGYADYRFEFDLELPLTGQGVTGWIVRAKDASNCLLFQLQSADSTCNAPEWKTRPNTLRPHVRRNGEFTLAEPVALPKKVRRGETHHIVVECRGSQVTVLLDGEKVLTQEDAGLRAGTVGFRAAGATERGLFSNISLKKLNWTLTTPSDAIQKGQTFLLNLFEPDIGLLPEYRGANVYWLFHDNYLAAKVLAKSHPETVKNILAAIHREGVDKSGKIELLFGEAEKPMPVRQYELRDVRSTANKIIRTEVATDRVLEGWEDYADLLLLASIAETHQPMARKHWETAIRMWDGQGFMDAAAQHDHRYSTYKLGLALLAASHLSPPAKPPRELINRLLAMQDDSGGWITDYDATGKKIGLANVETTCLAILGLEAFVGNKQSLPK